METQLKDNLNLLGHKVIDLPTGMRGVVDSITFSLSGRIVATIQPAYNEEEAKLPAGIYVDVNRLQLLSDEPVMPIPAFSVMPSRVKAAA